jgi:molecular chaperone GrpE (heat shock protein)
MDTNEKEHEDDIVYESEEETSSFKKPSVEKIKKQLKSCEAEKKEYLEGWQKARADLVNLRKQDEEEKKNLRKYASEAVVTDLISTLDSFDMAFGNKESWEAVSKEWRIGVFCKAISAPSTSVHWAQKEFRS